jgi:hypothetical protein
MRTSRGYHTLNQVYEERQVSKAVANDARPCAFRSLRNKRECDTCDCHADCIPESRLHE